MIKNKRKKLKRLVQVGGFSIICCSFIYLSIAWELMKVPIKSQNPVDF